MVNIRDILPKNPESRRRVESKPKQNPAARRAEPRTKQRVWKEKKEGRKEGREGEGKGKEGRGETGGKDTRTPRPFPPGNV